MAYKNVADLPDILATKWGDALSKHEQFTEITNDQSYVPEKGDIYTVVNGDLNHGHVNMYAGKENNKDYVYNAAYPDSMPAKKVKDFNTAPGAPKVQDGLKRGPVRIFRLK
jgi:hypothetical protein